jgi:hypothetical protein
MPKMSEKTVFQLVAERLGTSAVDALVHSLTLHYRLWKFQRWSDDASLSLAKRILCDAGFAKLCRDPGWIINRREADYIAALGPDVGRIRKMDQIRSDRLLGTANPYDEKVAMDGGPGNGTALYEGGVPGWKGCGYGIEMLYSLEGTLQNCLLPGVQGDIDGNTPSYASKVFRQAAKALEVLSVAEFAAARDSHSECDAAFEQWNGLSQHASATCLQRLIGSTPLARDLGSPSDPTRVAKGIVLGFLLDELEGRLHCPNGMNFVAGLLCELLGEAPNALKAASRTLNSTGVNGTSLVTAAGRLRQLVTVRFSQDTCDRAALSESDLHDCESVADSLREIAFRGLGEIDEDQRQILFALANELWRFVYFQRDLPRWDAARDPVAPASLLQWLERPWGILRADEMDALCRDLFGRDEPGSQPKAMFFLADFLRYGVDRALEGIFGSAVESATRWKILERFAERRIALARQRRAVVSVQIDDTEALRKLAAAQTVIQTFALWAQANPLIMDQIETRPQTLATVFTEGSWARAEPPTLSRRQLLELQRFSSDSSAFVAESFDFRKLGENPYSVLDFYPPENFVIQSVE